MVIVSEALLYVCFSLLVGALIVYAIPTEKKPSINVPKWLILLSIIGIAVLSFIPVLQLIITLAQSFGLRKIIEPVFTTFDLGKAWIFTVLLSAFLFILIKFVDIKQQKPFIYVALFQVCVLVLIQGWASHTHAMGQWKGLLAHTAHFLGVVVWVGVLLIVGWFAQNQNNWNRFLSWYSPLAIGCVFITFAAGIAVMQISVSFEGYATAWALPYGQALLFKHLFIIPTLLFAFINGTLIRRKLKKDEAFDPIPWTRVESLLLLIIFTITAALGQQAPPHNMGRSLADLEPSKLFQVFHTGIVDPSVTLIPTINGVSVMLIGIAVFLLTLTVVFFKKQLKPVYALTSSILFVIVSYLALMISV